MESNDGSEDDDLGMGVGAEASGDDVDAEVTDTSDEEEIRNTKGNIPLEWYDDLSHFGYDIEGKKILKPTSSDKDEVKSTQ